MSSLDDELAKGVNELSSGGYELSKDIFDGGLRVKAERCEVNGRRGIFGIVWQMWMNVDLMWGRFTF